MKKKFLSKLIIIGTLCIAIGIGIGMPILLQPQGENLVGNKSNSQEALAKDLGKEEVKGTKAEVDNKANASNVQASDKTIEDYKEIYEKHKDEIPEKDKNDGKVIKSKIDVNYISRLKNGGKVEPDKGPLIPYLKSKLTDEEVNRFFELYSKYKHFLEE